MGKYARDTRESPVDSLSRTRLSERTKELFGGFYLTMISIIQGVALGITITYYGQEYGRATDPTRLLYHVLVVLLTIALVTFEYTL